MCFFKIGFRLTWLAVALTAVPAVAGEIPLADFARHPMYRLVKISPDGEYIAANAVIDDKARLALLHLGDLKGVSVSAYEGNEVSDFWWVAPRQVMYTVAERTGEVAQPLATGELFVSDADGSHNKSIYGSLSNAGELLAILSDDPAHALITGYPYGRKEPFTHAMRLDLRKGGTEIVAKSPIRLGEFLADHSGHVRVAFGEESDLSRKVYYRPDESAEWKLAFDSSKGDEAIAPLMFDRDGKNVYATCDGANHVGGLCRWNIDKHEVSVLWSGIDAGLTRLLKTTDGRDIFGVASMPGRPKVNLFDQAAPDAKLLADLYKRFPGEDVTLGSSSSDGRKRIVFVDSDINPGDFYLYDDEKKSVAKILSRMPWIKPEQMAQMEPIKFEARDGLILHGYLTRPLGKEEAKNLPMVVLVHGGPYWVRDEWQFDPEVQMLASRGYAVLQVNFRGSAGYGRKFHFAGFGEWGGKMQDDVTDATQWAIKQGVADAHRVCIYGASYGGYAALEGAVKEPDLYKCAIGDAGVYDLRLMYERGDIHQTERGENYLKDALGQDVAVLSERSPIAHLDRLRAKVMIIVGGADRRVPPIHGQNLHKALSERKVEHEWIYHLNEGHGYFDVAHTTDMYEKIVAFLDRNIGPTSQSAAVK